MSKSKKGKRSSKRQTYVKIAPCDRYSGRHAYRAAALMAAVGLSLSAVIGTMPDTVSKVMSVSIDDAAYMAYTQEHIKADVRLAGDPIGTIDFSDEFVIPEEETSEEPEETFDFTDYVTQLSEEETHEKLNKATVTTKSGYVGYNSLGIAMSEYEVPSYLSFDENGVPENYSYVIEGKSTAYYAGSITSTGTTPRQGTVAVDPRQIPYGTEMWIVSLDGSRVYGYCKAEDTGGFIYFSNGATVDLYMHSKADAINWGWRGVRVYILNSNG